MTKQIQKAVGARFVNLNCLVVENITLEVGEYDVAAISLSNLIHEVEVKISRSDFAADASKRKWTFYEQRVHCPNYFYYACPEGLIIKNEIPVYAGLLYFANGKIETIRNAKRLHKAPVTDWHIRKFLRLHSERHFLGACKMTVKNREQTEYVKEHFPELLL